MSTEVDYFNVFHESSRGENGRIFNIVAFHWNYSFSQITSDVTAFLLHLPEQN